MSKQIQEQTKRVTKIVQSLVNFSHAGHHTQRHDPVSISYCVDEAIHLLQLNKTGVDILFENQCTPGLQVLGDASRLVQVFVNLLSNAQDACQQGNRIIVDTQADEQQVTIRVIDEGQGVDHAVVERVFEPFFTTKDVGKGTGLGLALVYSIIDEHYGNVSLKSPWANGHGTCVIIYLPRFIDQNDTENEV
jgi:signal transduction histidine kinase